MGLRRGGVHRLSRGVPTRAAHVSFPALLAFEDDRASATIARVYTHLRKHELVFYEPRPVKVSAVASTLRMQRARFGNAVQWLVDHGYLIDRGRDGKLRLLILAYEAPVVRRVPMSHAS